MCMSSTCGSAVSVIEMAGLRESRSAISNVSPLLLRTATPSTKSLPGDNCSVSTVPPLDFSGMTGSGNVGRVGHAMPFSHSVGRVVGGVVVPEGLVPLVGGVVLLPPAAGSRSNRPLSASAPPSGCWIPTDSMASRPPHSSSAFRLSPPQTAARQAEAASTLKAARTARFVFFCIRHHRYISMRQNRRLDPLYPDCPIFPLLCGGGQFER